jgi:2-polyprenyl-3-methyl-5-hydroxy-6-metoxy-1,4-benzoquinol methylase
VISNEPAQIQQRCVPHGVEISKELARLSNEAMAKTGGYCIQDNAISGLSRFPKEYFDVIILSSFLEHEIKPLELLRLCRLTLRPGGRIIVKVPNHASLNRSVRGRKWCGYRWPDHVNYFTPETIRKFADAANLRVERMTWLDRHPLSDNMYLVLGS